MGGRCSDYVVEGRERMEGISQRGKMEKMDLIRGWDWNEAKGRTLLFG
jgi:hypothetical protein